jgi:hypothetical protein
MEISFNTSRIPNPAAKQPVARPSESSPAPAEASLSNVEALNQSLKDIPLVRPEKVEQARNLVADVKYPPTEVLDRISNLLALHLNK